MKKDKHKVEKTKQPQSKGQGEKCPCEGSQQQTSSFSDRGYNSCWFKVSEEKAIGLGDMLGFVGPPEEVKAWVFNEFSMEAIQLRTKAIDLEVKSRLKCLENLKKNVSRQIEILESQVPPINTNERPNKINNSNQKSLKPKGS